jgi:NAD(P)-dependent dehydrogenase (short-subunit alcohol dehydrogenase family)
MRSRRSIIVVERFYNDGQAVRNRPHRSTRTNARSTSIRADLTQPTDIERLCEVIVRRFGQVDLLINGAARRDWSPLLAPDALRPMEALMSLNVLAPLRLSVGLARRAWQLDRIAHIMCD